LNVTVPVGAIGAPDSVAVSFRVLIAFPTVPVVGLATVLIVGDAFPITIFSGTPPQVLTVLLLASPL